MSLRASFFKTQTEGMTEAGSTPQGKHRSAERDSSSSKTKHCQGKKHLSALWYWDHKRFTMSQNPQRCLFFMLGARRKKAKERPCSGLFVFSAACLCDVTRWYPCMSKPFVYMLWGMQVLTGGRAVISWRRSCESHSAYQMLEGLCKHITAAAVLSGTLWRRDDMITINNIHANSCVESCCLRIWLWN